MALQMAARTVLAEVTIWALSTFLLVWFWVRHYLPLGSHYFRLWLFSWLFSEVIPLRFLNVPYNGQRYPILSSYLFLERQDFTAIRSLAASGITPDGGRFQRCWREPSRRPTCSRRRRQAVRANTSAA
jgi:hypothetical protein